MILRTIIFLVILFSCTGFSARINEFFDSLHAFEDLLVCDIFDGSIKVWNTSNGSLIKNNVNSGSFVDNAKSLDIIMDKIALRTDYITMNAMKRVASKLSINSCWTISSLDSLNAKTTKALKIFSGILENMSTIRERNT